MRIKPLAAAWRLEAGWTLGNLAIRLPGVFSYLIGGCLTQSACSSWKKMRSIPSKVAGVHKALTVQPRRARTGYL